MRLCSCRARSSGVTGMTTTPGNADSFATASGFAACQQKKIHLMTIEGTTSSATSKLRGTAIATESLMLGVHIPTPALALLATQVCVFAPSDFESKHS
jgi:hypothetical protein